MIQTRGRSFGGHRKADFSSREVTLSDYAYMFTLCPVIDLFPVPWEYTTTASYSCGWYTVVYTGRAQQGKSRNPISVLVSKEKTVKLMFFFFITGRAPVVFTYSDSLWFIVIKGRQNTATDGTKLNQISYHLSDRTCESVNLNQCSWWRWSPQLVGGSRASHSVYM